MKTILYQPIFINPQAYFVFPPLYHIWVKNNMMCSKQQEPDIDL